MQLRRSVSALVPPLLAAALAACGGGDLAASTDAASGGGGQGSPELVVMTRNLFVGADLFAPFTAEDPLLAASTVWGEILASDAPARMAAIADEIARARPDLVGLQEVYRFVVTPLGMSGPVLLDLDFLALLHGALTTGPDALPYEIAAVQPQTVLTLPFPDLGVQITMTDRDAILADEDVEILSSTGGSFEAAFVTTLAGVIPVVQKRGWVQVQAEYAGTVFTFVNTHLEVKEFGPLQSLQALELLAVIGSASPLVLVGDINSDADDPRVLPALPTPYELLAGALADAWRGEGHGGGQTCCYDADLAPPTRPLLERVDLVLLRGAVETRAPHRTGIAPLAELGGRFPSDHAGVVVPVRLDDPGPQ